MYRRVLTIAMYLTIATDINSLPWHGNKYSTAGMLVLCLLE